MTEPDPWVLPRGFAEFEENNGLPEQWREWTNGDTICAALECAAVNEVPFHLLAEPFILIGLCSWHAYEARTNLARRLKVEWHCGDPECYWCWRLVKDRRPGAPALRHPA
ncbi:hypothetical protein [Microbacterium capsulatum]|uniref:Uncharacterized protein n=1 Tax=Microbacterium capsulatum TaxID=3041921 RepID=A0ABU0XK35_9MICO|nr:hypothetical protein [Microbacterium sp. ASV81]MDQ4214055.1 hypothetical protein [Microbacterium sp. ASV81]